MIHPSIDKLLTVVNSKYELVIIAAKRSRQVAENDHLQMPASEYQSQKNIGKALEEVSENLIKITN